MVSIVLIMRVPPAAAITFDWLAAAATTRPVAARVAAALKAGTARLKEDNIVSQPCFLFYLKKSENLRQEIGSLSLASPRINLRAPLRT